MTALWSTKVVPADQIASVDVRLRRGVARCSVEERIDELNALIHIESDDKQIRNMEPFWFMQRIADGTRTTRYPCEPAEEGKPTSIHSLIEYVTITALQAQDMEILILDGIPDKSLFRFYVPTQDTSFSQSISVDNNEDSTTMGSQHWSLPALTFEGLWHSLIFDGPIKTELFSYVLSLIRLASAGVDTKYVNVNRLIMLLGPPGTGKTSLCQALAHQMSISLQKKFPRSVLIEINTHSLFSKWFSESGKLVMKMFDQIDEAAEDTKNFVFVLIDEIESLGINRSDSASRGDPADSIRAVNALLTQIDRIRRRPNVFIMCTSNLKECLDPALVDRADLIKLVPTTGRAGVMKILTEAVSELKRVKLLEFPEDASGECALLEVLVEKLVGSSGRFLRKLPALIYANSRKEKLTFTEFLDGLAQVILEREADAKK
ncbi:unnamed protein product, partial [Mesorhabditis spiculigera]